MPYQFLPGEMYRMPTHFGPATGPRQGEGGRRFINVDSPKRTVISVKFLTAREQLDALLPDGFGLTLEGEPVVSVDVTYLTDLEWLAGRGYNTLGVSFPVAFHGERDHIKGRFLTVLWENLSDPITTGREELGFAKVYCEIPEARVLAGETHCAADWLGFRFMDLKVGNMKPVSPEQLAPLGTPAYDGIIHFKYIPRTGELGTADAAYVTLTPSTGNNVVVKEAWRGEGTVEFHHARWEDMPTQFNIVNGLQDLQIKEYRGAMIARTVGWKDLGDQRILH